MCMGNAGPQAMRAEDAGRLVPSGAATKARDAGRLVPSVGLGFVIQSNKRKKRTDEQTHRQIKGLRAGTPT